MALGQFAVGDYGTVASGNWGTAAVWNVWNGSAWVNPATYGSFSCTTTLNSTTLTTASTATLPVGATISGTGIPAGTTIATIVNGTTFTISNLATAGGTNTLPVTMPTVPDQSIWNVWVRNGHTVALTCSAAPRNCRNLTVMTGGKLWTANCATNTYVYVYGSTLQCDGVIGDGSNFDGISFGAEGANMTIQGSGTLDCSRLRKNLSTPNATTNLVIAMNMNVRFAGGSTTQIYNSSNAQSIFNVTVNAGVVVNLVGTSGTGNLAMDGINGADPINRGGAYFIYGTVNMNGILYLTTNNGAGYPCSVRVYSTGIIRCNSINATTVGGVATHTLTVDGGGRIEVQGTPTAWNAVSTGVNNIYSLAATSTFEYSGNGPQGIWSGVPGGYGNLRVTGTGTKSLDGLITIKGNLDIENISGAPSLDCSLSSWNINLAGNWTSYNQTGFTERLGTVILNGSGPQLLTTTGGERFYNLRMSKVGGSTASLGSDVSVANQLNFFSNGVLDLNQRRLALESPLATAVVGGNASRYILSEQTNNSSRVQWNIGTTTGTHLIPFGRPGGYIPFTFDLTAGDAGNVTVSTYGTAADNLPFPTSPTLVTNLASVMGLVPDNRFATVDRFWQVDPTGTPTATLTFTYLSTELPGAPYNLAGSMISQRYNAAINGWETPTVGQTAAAFTNTSPGITTFGPFALSPQTFPLPVEWLFFTATPMGDDVLLEWATAAEFNNDHFEVERSSDGASFEVIGTLRSGGSGSTTRTYSHIDQRPLPGTSYYRVRQVDLDGGSKTSEVLSVRRDVTAAGPIPPFYPNPASDRLWLRTTTDGLPSALEFLDARGRSLAIMPVNTTGGAEMDLGRLLPGAYLVRAIGVAEPKTWPLIIAR